MLVRFLRVVLLDLAASQPTLIARRHHKYATLAVHGQDSLWSLCPTGNNGGKNEVFYNISSTTPEPQIVVPEDCYKVTLQIVRLH